jgi:IclR family KDG regulon transcriptional repressor
MAALVKSAMRTLDLLELISTSKNGLLLSELAKALNVPISSMHGLISTLEHREYLVRDQTTQRYHFGPRFVQLVTSGTSNVDLVSLASKTLDRLQQECKEAITMSMLQMDRIIFISNRFSSSIVQVVNKVGTSLPAHATGSGKVMLAHLPPEEIDRIYPQQKLVSQTEKTIRTKAELMAVLEEVKQQGYAYDEGESEEGVWAVASCILDSVGMPCAAMSIVLPEVRVQQSMIPKWTELVVSAAQEISKKLGLTPELRTGSQVGAFLKS